MNKNILIAPSILSADFGRLNEEVADVESKGADVLHVDTMDGHFVPNLSFGAPVMKCIETAMPKHCHLMVSNPLDRVDEFVEAGADTIIFHIEALGGVSEAAELIGKIKSCGVKAGLSLKPGTEPDYIAPLLVDSDIGLDEVLVMSVEPGFGGQSFMPSSIDKIRALREMRPDLLISVDGGINGENAKLLRDAGANLLVSGSYIFKAENRESAIRSLRE